MSRYDLIDSPEMMEIGLMAFSNPEFAERFITDLAGPSTPTDEPAAAEQPNRTDVAA